MMTLEGVVDSHVHVYPELSLKVRNAAPDDEWLREAVEAGMRAVCLKSHFWPTTGEAHTLERMVPGIRVCGSITLNVTVGGLNPLAVRIAAEGGARVVWFPTWSALNDVRNAGYSAKVTSFYEQVPPGRLTVVDEAGSLHPHVDEILAIIARYDLALATGHLGVAESKVLIRRAREHGVKRIVFTHPLARMVGASIEDQEEVAAMGAFVEHTLVATMPMHQQLAPKKIVESVRAVGPEHCIISSDAVFAWNPSSPEMMRMFIEMLMEAGFAPEDIDLMARHNPAYLLGLD